MIIINKFKQNLIYSTLILLALSFLLGCSSSKMINSKFDNTIKVDGDLQDWGGQLVFDEDNNISVGFKNDNQNLYIAVAASREFNVLKILNLGLTVWLESEETGEKIGIRFPQKSDDNDMPMMRPRGEKREEPQRDMKEMVNKLIVKQDEITIVNEDEFPLYAFNRNSKEGLGAGLDFSMGRLGYELRVPLADNNSSEFYFNALPGSTVLAEIISGEFNRSKRAPGISPPMDGAMGGAGMRGGGRSGGKIGQFSGDRSNMMKQIDVKVELKLADN